MSGWSKVLPASLIAAPDVAEAAAAGAPPAPPLAALAIVPQAAVKPIPASPKSITAADVRRP
ncbi:MAG TPA: hypothetical protein VI365_32850 [Trebonia sp.]